MKNANVNVKTIVTKINYQKDWIGSQKWIAPFCFGFSLAMTTAALVLLAVRGFEDMRGEQSRNALVVAGARGKGRVLMLTTDSMWRLRSKFGDQRHHRFWGQVSRATRSFALLISL